MSADNGIYILKTKDQYRVNHAQAIEIIFADYNGEKLNPIEVLLVWGGCRYTRDELTAYKIAELMERKNRTEYGIRTFKYNKTWKHIVEDAKKEAEVKKNEILSKSSTLASWDRYRLEVCEHILNL